MRKIVISVAPVSGKPIDKANNPQSPQEIAREVIACANEGASMVHLHVRDKMGELTSDITEFSKTLRLIRCESDIVIQGSTGGLSSLSLEERCTALIDPLVECASLNMGSLNYNDDVYINTLPDIRYWADRMKKAGVHPELEIFEGGMINNAKILMDEKYLEQPMTYCFCLGLRGALPASVESLFFLKGLLEHNEKWGVIHTGMKDFSFLVMALGMGASCIRVGYEDSVYYLPDKVAVSNAELVKRIVGVVKDLGYEIASPNEARKILSISR